MLSSRHILVVAVTVVTGCLTRLPAYADCKLSPAPSKVPDAGTATEGAMVAAMQTLKRYNTDVSNYCKCLEFEANQSRMNRGEQQRLNNQAIDALKTIAEKFNEQVRVFKAKSN